MMTEEEIKSAESMLGSLMAHIKKYGVNSGIVIGMGLTEAAIKLKIKPQLSAVERMLDVTEEALKTRGNHETSN